ncbi:NAD(P)H-binding protein [Streptomyces sp. BHT-5-2]|uniref:SDR family oxidoreductase n=1 Tax=Streptomyces sp. BHT-5-2 TaxID=2866715 RepID=UPI001C8E5055|nr:NAD(P)H-binding protein [Streptomyces sp. BHT-5-2]QZL06408.1 NAD(P)H-binding protein [Streptomyces sp. BHT-5-2]
MILVVGATGNVGRALVPELVQRGVPVRALSRQPDALLGLDGVQPVAGDLDLPDSLEAALRGVDSVFVATRASRMPDHVAGLVTAAEQAGVRRLVLLSSLSVEGEPLETIGRWHAAGERIVRESRLSWTFLRAGAFASNALEWADGIRTDGVVRALYGNVVTAPVAPEDLAEVAARALTEPRHEGRVLRVTGAQRISAAEQARLIGGALGRPLRFEEVPQETALRYFAWCGPDAAATLDALRDSQAPWSQAGNAVRELTGRPALSFEDWLADHVDDFR